MDCRKLLKKLFFEQFLPNICYIIKSQRLTTHSCVVYRQYISAIPYMKNLLALFLSTSALCIAICSCSKHESADNIKQNDTIHINNFEINQIVKTGQRSYICNGANAFFDDSLRIYSSSTVAIQWPVKMNGYDISTLQDSLKVLALGATHGTIDDAIINALDHPQGEDLYSMKPVDSIPMSSKCMILYKTVIASAVTFSPHFIVYQVLNSMYDGGAHGIILSRYLTYIFKLNKVLDIPTAFKPGSEKDLLKAIQDQLMTQYGATTLSQLDGKGIFTDQLYVSPNFYIHGYDIVFHYNPYDIAAFSEGSIDIRVPYQSVAEHLTPTMLAIMERESI